MAPLTSHKVSIHDFHAYVASSWPDTLKVELVMVSTSELMSFATEMVNTGNALHSLDS